MRGLDAPDALLAHLRNKLMMRPGMGCRRAAATPRNGHAAAATAAPSPPLVDENGDVVPATYAPVPLVDHGPSVPPQPAVDYFVWTSGVV